MENQPYLDFRELCDSLYDGIHIADGTGKVLYINKAYTRTTGIKYDEVVGRRVQDIEKEGKLYTGSVTGKVLSTKKMINSVAKILRNNKRVLVTGTPVFNEKGEIAFVVTNTRDFSELQEMERKLEALTNAQTQAAEELAYLRARQLGTRSLHFASRAMEDVITLCHSVARTEVSILITGESGTGKELIANEIYQHSQRNGKPFIKINCAAIPAELLESELFGYEGGAFTDAKKQGKAGMFELADTGIILLDEIGDMPLALQTKLLRVLQSREILRIGASSPKKLDFRLIASTNKDLKKEIVAGRFRDDLYYRINVVPIHLPPLRQRPEDISVLATMFCGEFNKKHNTAVTLSPEALQTLSTYDWPGNIRELENFMERLVVTSTIDVVNGSDIASTLASAVRNSDSDKGGLKAQMAFFEKHLIESSLRQHGSIRKAAKMLEIDHSTLVKKCKAYGLKSGF